MTLAAIGALISIAGFIVGLGAVTVIDIHGFLGRRSSYWTLATTRTHKVTKPLIWAGTGLLVVGTLVFYSGIARTDLLYIQLAVLAVLILNGLFLSLRVSPFLLSREREGKSEELLPESWQRAITASFVVSFIGWWGSVLFFVWSLPL